MALLEEGGASLDSVLKTIYLLSDMGSFAAFYGDSPSLLLREYYAYCI